ncbi:putative metalloprotease CJM1_0395 family protein [Chitinimonas sp.]|uniref:putative metalloprotease CJM1_0395 family protein n=1 Tax=Chitinimonas sp. TaxID=1934313 RepID=UPI0035B3C3BA
MSISTIGSSVAFSVKPRLDTAGTLAEPANVSVAGANLDTNISSSTTAGKKYSDAQQSAIAKLEARDREVRQHEQAHLAAAGGIAVSGPSYSFEKGPDGKNYAVGGEVQIDVSPGRTPQETLDKAKQIQRAALAPKDPSGPDRAVAAEASQLAQDAAIQLQQQSRTPDEADAPLADRASDRINRAYSDGSQNPATSLISAYA